MGFSLMPDNFLYFISLFTISIIGGTHLLFKYKRSWLNYMNAAMFCLCGLRACSEYYLPQLEQYEDAVILMTYHGPVSFLLAFFTWITLFYHVRPFERTIRSWKRDLFAFIFFVIPSIIILYHLFQRNLFETNIAKINGFWTFRNLDHWSLDFYNTHLYILMPLIMIGLFIYGIVIENTNRLKQSILAISFIVLPWAMSFAIVGQTDNSWKVPNFAGLFLIQTIIVTWFLSGYRLFNDGFTEASGDLLNSISDLSIQTDLKMNVVHVNSKFSKLFDAPESNIYYFITENSRLRGFEVNEILQKLLNGEKDSIEVSLIDKHNEERLFLFKVSDLIWRGKKNGLTFLFSDQTDLKIKENKLIEINNTKDQIFSMIAHDLRKPALAFKGVTNKVNYLIQKREFNLLNTLGDSIEKSAIQLNALLDNLLKWALSQKGMINIKTEPVGIKSLTDDLIETFELITSEKGVLIDNRSIDENLLVESDPDVLLTILRNLLDNAIKFSKTDSTIVLGGERRNEQVVIEVKDEGIGMTEDQLARLFDIYKDKSKMGTHGESGSGLGLNLVMKLVERCKGEIKCESSLGRGTKFVITFAKLKSLEN